MGTGATEDAASGRAARPGGTARVSPSPPPSFATVALRYDELRPVDDSWWEVFDALVREGDLRGRRVLDVGCGTGALAAALAERAVCRVWGIDSSEEMLAVARANVAGVRFKQARAEQLPFKDGWFERVVLRMSLHLFDRPRALRESRRVLGPSGRLAIATGDPEHFGELWIHRWFPTIAAVDRERFPTKERLIDELEAAGFDSVHVDVLQQDRTITRDQALAKIRGRAFSTFQLIPPAEYEAGLVRAEAELAPVTAAPSRWLIVVAG
jgi:SAM-dependent methyltransferase